MQDPEQVRAEKLSPVSPKPLHYPSPSNIPILEASMDPDFSETVTQSMPPPVPLPSVAQHSMPVLNPDNAAEDATSSTATATATATDDAVDPATAEDVQMTNGVDGAGEAAGDDQLAKTNQSPSSSSDAVGHVPNDSLVQATHSLSSEPATSDKDGLAPPVENSLASVDVAAPLPDIPEPEPEASADPDASSASLVAPKPIDTPNVSDNGVDYSAILASLSNVIANATPAESSTHATPAPAANTVQSPTAGAVAVALPSNPSLPPKPPAQEKPTIHPNYVAGDSLRNYHPHQKETGGSYRPQQPPNLNTSIANHGGSQQHPLSAGLTAGGSAVSGQSQRAGSPGDDSDAPWDPQLQPIFDQFIQFERQNMQDGQWDKFPNGSRLFIGNLSTEKVHKKDVFRKFYRYGQLAQISLKQAYGFVQFMDPGTCATALSMEQGQKLRGREMHLEISKPAKNTRNDRNSRKRSRSPDFHRSGPGRVDRYTSSPRDRDNRRSRDDWRRSPSPRRGFNSRGADRYDGRRRDRSRSPPYESRDRGGASNPDEIDLPWRAPHQVPDIQVIVVDDIDQDYVRWVDGAMKSRGLRVDVLMLSPRMSEEAVVRRQVMEGVTAVVHLYRADRLKNKVPLRIFNRSGGGSNVSFDQYVDLDPTVAADLVLRAKQAQTQAPPPMPPQQYGLPQQQPPYTQQSTYGFPQQGPPQPPTHRMPPSTTNPAPYYTAPARPGQPPATGITPDVERLLRQMGQPANAPYGAPPPQHPQQQHPTPGSFAGRPGVGVQPPSAQGATDIQQLLANLNNYKPPG